MGLVSNNSQTVHHSIDHTIDSELVERGSGQAKRNRSAVGGSESSITTAMINSGVPFPLCRIVIDLIGRESCDELLFLFRSNDSYQSFSNIFE